MAPRTRSFISTRDPGDESTTSAFEGTKRSLATSGYTDPDSEPAAFIPHTDLASNSRVEETSPGMLTSLDHAPVCSVNEEVIKIATDVIKRSTGGVNLQSGGQTYYGVQEGDLVGFIRLREPVFFLAEVLVQVVKACEATQPQNSLCEAMSLFNSAMENSGSRPCYSRCQVYFGHARRMMARLIVVYQGYQYHEDQSGEVSNRKETLMEWGSVGKRKTSPPPSGILALYKKCNPNWMPLQILIWQLSGLSKELSKVVAELLESVPDGHERLGDSCGLSQSTEMHDS